MAALFSAGCGLSAGPGPELPKVETEQQATCQAAKDPMNPLIVEWPATAKTSLATAAQRGLVVVSYQGCTMKVLENCDGGGAYKATPLSQANSERIVIDTEDKLFAELPIGVASLRGRIKKGQRLTLDYTAVGNRTADGEPLALQGQCAGATHYLRSMTVGAYALMVSASQEVAGSAEGAGAKVGGEHSGNDERVHGSGDPKVCKDNPESPTCGAILQVSVAELPKPAVSGGEKRAGFGSGLGGLAPMPTIGKLREVELTGLADLDPALLRRVEVAIKFERDKAIDSEQKRDTWANVVAYEGKNTYRDEASSRMRSWELVSEAEAAHAIKARAVCQKHTADDRKLKELLGIDAQVLSADKKAGLQKEFDRAYAPFSEILADCETWERRAGQSWVTVARTRAEDRERRGVEEKEARALETSTARNTAELERSNGVRRFKTVVMVGGGLAAVAGGALFTVGAVQASSATSSCVGTTCPPSAEADAKTAATLANVGMGLGIGGAVVFLGGLLWPMPSARPSAGERTAWRLVPGPGNLGFGASGSF